jgi:hypothetical protein
VDTKLGTERNDEDCSKGLWGRMGWCVAPFIGSRWCGEGSERESSGRRGVQLQRLPLRSQKGGGGGESVEHCLMRGNRGSMDGALLPLPWSTGGRPMAACGVAASTRPTAARVTEVGDEQGSGLSGLHKSVG